MSVRDCACVVYEFAFLTSIRNGYLHVHHKIFGSKGDNGRFSTRFISEKKIYLCHSKKMFLFYLRGHRRLKGIHSRSDTNRTGAEGLSIYYPRLLCCPDQMLAVMVFKPASSFIIQNRQTSCSMWCPM